MFRSIEDTHENVRQIQRKYRALTKRTPNDAYIDEDKDFPDDAVTCSFFKDGDEFLFSCITKHQGTDSFPEQGWLKQWILLDEKQSVDKAKYFLLNNPRISIRGLRSDTIAPFPTFNIWNLIKQIN